MCYFSKCFSHVLFNNVKTMIFNSQFSNFLNQPVFNENKNIFEERYVYDKDNVLLIENSYFRNCKSVNSGGAIYYFSNSFNYVMNIKNTLFENCMTENNGGAIFFAGENASLSLVSAKMCNANIDGQFCHLSTSVLRNGYFNLDYIAVSKCSNEKMNGRYNSVYLKSGIQQISYLNSTDNFVSHSGSSLFISTSFYFTMKNCFYSNNRNSSLFEFYANSNSTVTSSIFYNNSNQFQSYGIISFNTICNFYHCKFILNKGILFYRNNFYINLYNCSINDSKKKWSCVKLFSCTFINSTDDKIFDEESSLNGLILNNHVNVMVDFSQIITLLILFALLILLITLNGNIKGKLNKRKIQFKQFL